MLDSVHEHAFVIKLPQTLFVASEPNYRIPRALVYPARNPEARHDGRTMSKQVQITFDASDPHGLAAWWADLLGYAVGPDLVSGLLESRIITDADVVELNGRLFFKDAIAASDPDDDGPRLYFQRVPEPTVVKNRVHLDIPVNPVMQDPEGNEFCLH